MDGWIKRRALYLLSRREHSVFELKQKLLKKGCPVDVLEELLNKLKNENLLNDERFIEIFIRSRHRKGYGPLKICAELQNRGIDPSQIFANEEWCGTDWQEKAVMVRKKRFGPSLPTCHMTQAKQARFLRQRGFTAEQSRKALACRDSHDDEYHENEL